jgi:hypothetical protein
VDGFDTMINTRGAIEIEYSSIRMLGLAGLFLLLMGLCAAFVVVLRAPLPILGSSFAEFIFFAGAMFFGAATAVLLWRVFTTRGPVVTITPEGIRDVRVAAELIAWSASTTSRCGKTSGSH